MNLIREKVMNLNWKQEYELNIPELDVQHRRFLCLIKLLFHSDESSCSLVINEIYRYAVFHFRSEEEFMKAYDYSDLAAHMNEHDNLTQIITEAVYKSNESLLDAKEFSSFLITWFVEHTIYTDVKMSTCLRDKGTMITCCQSI